VAGYCLVCGGSTPVVRAGLMSMICMFSLLARRQADMLTACACSALCILVSDPGQLFSPSFQLSYASVLSLIGIFPRLRSVFPGRMFCLRRSVGHWTPRWSHWLPGWVPLLSSPGISAWSLRLLYWRTYAYPRLPA